MTHKQCTALALGLQPILFTFLPIQTAWSSVVLADGLIYGTLFLYGIRTQMRKSDMLHHCVASAALLAMPVISNNTQMRLTGMLLLANNCLMCLVLSEALLQRRTSLILLGIFRLLLLPAIWFNTIHDWHSWHHGMHLLAWLFIAYRVTVECGAWSSTFVSGTSRDWMFFVCSLLQGKRLTMVGDALSARAMLVNSVTKGTFLEKLHAAPTWDPIISVESIDGPQWKRMARGVHLVMRQCSVNIEEICRQCVLRFRKDGSSDLREIVAAVFHRVVFHHIPSMCAVRLWCDAASTISMTLSVQRHTADKHLLREALNMTSSICKTCVWWADLRKICQSNREALSCVLQPFIISPIINVTDALAAMVTESPSISTDREIIQVIARHPPFPVFERWNVEQKEHLVFNNDRSPSSHHWRAFGAGPRACPGQRLAISVVRHLYCEWLCQETDPWKYFGKHTCSGRHNDHSRESELSTQLVVSKRVFKDSWRERCRG